MGDGDKIELVVVGPPPVYTSAGMTPFAFVQMLEDGYVLFTPCNDMASRIFRLLGSEESLAAEFEDPPTPAEIFVLGNLGDGVIYFSSLADMLSLLRREGCKYAAWDDYGERPLSEWQDSPPRSLEAVTLDPIDLAVKVPGRLFEEHLASHSTSPERLREWLYSLARRGVLEEPHADLIEFTLGLSRLEREDGAGASLGFDGVDSFFF